MQRMMRFLMKKLRLAAGVLAVLCYFVTASSAGTITKLRIGQGVGTVRIVFEADSNLDYNVFTLSEPNRLVIDLKGVDVSPSVISKTDENIFVKNVRLGTPVSNEARIVFDLKKPILVKKAFILRPQANFSWRFAIDIEGTSEREFVSRIGNSNAQSSETFNSAGGSAKVVAQTPKPQKQKALNEKKIIVIDAGHGGVDPGAIGYNGTYEKNITLAFAKELKEVLDKNGNYKVYLTRNRDVFIPLRDRVKISRGYGADLFISIHADSAKNKTACGLSVYTLSKTASDKEAAALAEKENKADIVAGVNFAEYSKDINDVLLDLSQTRTNNLSAEFASSLSSEMSKIVKTVSNTHRFAGFAVLKAPDVPSVLVELGYLSNPAEERQLKQKSYRTKLVEATAKSIKKYFENMKHY